MKIYFKTPNQKSISAFTITGLLTLFSILFYLSGCIGNPKEKPISTNNSEELPFKNYREKTKMNISKLSPKDQEIRLSIVNELNKNQLYLELLNKKNIDQKYLQLLEAIGEGMIFSAKDQTFSLATSTEHVINKIPNATQLVIDIIRLDIFGGLDDKFLDVIYEYQNEFGISGNKGDVTYNADGNVKFKVDKDFTLTRLLAIIDNKNPKILDAYYEAVNSRKIHWSSDPKNQYVYFHLLDKYLFNNYLKLNYPESKYYVNFDIKTTARSFYEEYDANEVAADDKYKNKKIAVTGVINGIGIDILDKPYITLRTGDYGSIQCFFIDKTVVKNLRKGSNITVVGSCSGKTLGNVIIFDTILF